MTPPDVRTGGWTPYHTAATALLVAAGWALRLVQYVANPSLWNDEQLLALNIGRRSALELLRPLEHDQAAPVGFLEIQRLVTRLFGVNDLSLRLLPLLAGLALVLLGVLIARRLVRPDSVVLAALVFAVSPRLLAYGAEMKPYETDAALAALLLWLALRLHDNARPSTWRAVRIAGCLAVWFSFPALFVVAALSSWLLLDARLRTELSWRRAALTTLGCWALSGAALYLLFLRPSSGVQYLHDYMRPAFVSLSLGGIGRAWSFFGGELLEGAVFPASMVRGWPAGSAVLHLGCAVAGLLVLLRRRGLALAALFAAPFAVSLAAAVLQVYPLAARLQLWLLPFLLTLVIVGLDSAAALLPRPAWQRAALAVVALLVLATAGRRARYRVFHSTAVENARAVVDAWRSSASAAPVYVAARGAPAWIYYTTDWHQPDTARLDWFAERNGSTGPAFRNAPTRVGIVDEEDDLTRQPPPRLELLGWPSGMQITLAGMSQPAPDPGWAESEARRIRAAAAPEVWVFFSHQVQREHHLLRDAVVAAGGTLVRSVEETGAALYLVRF